MTTAARRPTIYNVARAAGVSHQMVSRVLNGTANVADDTRTRVLDAVRALGFVPNEAARRLRDRDAKRIGVLAQQVTEDGPSITTATAIESLQAAGYSVDLALIADLDAAGATAAMRRFETTTRAVLALTLTDAIQRAVDDAEATIPVHSGEGLYLDTATAPSTETLIGRAAAKHLRALGHERVLHLPGPADSRPARSRASAFRSAGETQGLEVALTAAGDWSEASGARIAEEIRPGQVTAIFVANDSMAIGAMQTLRRRGIRVPQDLAVLGADDIPAAAYVHPALSSVAHDLQGKGRHAAHALLTELGEASAPPQPLSIAVQVRRSTLG